VQPISYEVFGARFVRHAVSVERIERTIGAVAAEPVQLGPEAMGPGGAAEVRARGEVREVRARRVGDVDAEVRRQVTRVVNDRIDSEAARRARTIDILPLIDVAWRPPGE
jgi:hypothetical protein